jgi:hypothetical protein
MQIPSSDRATHPPQHLAIVVTTWPSAPPILTSHLHSLLHTSSLLHPCLPPTRFVALPRSSEKQLCSVLGVSRAGFIGIFDSAPSATAIFEFCDANVPDIQFGKWLETDKTAYMPLRVNIVEAADPALRNKVGINHTSEMG